MIRLTYINDRYSLHKQYSYSALFHEEVTHSGRARYDSFSNHDCFGSYFDFVSP